MRDADKLWWIPTALAAAFVLAGPARAGEQDDTPQAAPGEIVVYGERLRDLFAGILADDEIGENDIAAYGFDTVGELINEVAREADNGNEGPVILINGEQTNGLSDVSDLPTEAVTRIQILPRGSATRLGQSASRRVINVVIKRDLRQVTGNTNTRMTTRGDALAVDGEANLLRLHEGNRTTLVLRARKADPLLESQREIAPDVSGIPFDLTGNVIAAAGLGQEIDPLLSALAGLPVTVAGIPESGAPTALGDFARTANMPNASDLGAFRSLQSEAEGYSVNANLTRRLDPDTTSSLTGRLEHTLGRSLNGAPTASLFLPVGSPFSPFSKDVVVARAFGDALAQDSRVTALSLSQTLNTRVSKFAFSFLANFNHRVSRTESDRGYDLAALEAGIFAGTTNPLAPIDPVLLGSLRSDISRSTSSNGQLQAIANGPLLALPAGAATFSAKLALRQDRQTSTTAGRTVNFARSFERTERIGQVGLALPLLGGGFVDGIGGLTLDLIAAVREISRSPTLYDYGATLSWDPLDALNLRFTRNVEETAPPSSAVNDPVIVIDNFRTFDFVRQETVLVRYLTGGNVTLPVQRRTRTSIAATLRPLGNSGLTLDGEYEREVGRDAFATLPPADARVQLAFPDRYVRDAAGVLVQLDARPITYEREARELVRGGINFRRTFGGTVSASEAEGLDGESAAPTRAVSAGRGWRVSFNADHTWYLENTRLIRAGLPLIDLLDGGAAGFAGGQPRHLLRLSSAVYHAGIGFQLNADYRGRSTVASGTIAAPDEIRFAARTLVNTRVFVNMGPQFPQSSLAKGMRTSLAFTNLLDSRQRVTDSAGATPLRYQPFLLDPLGRTVTVSLRKVF